MPHSFSERFARFLLAGRWFLLGLSLLLFAVCFQKSRQVQFDRSFENMFAPDDPLLPPYLRLKQVFGGNEVVVAVYSDPRLLDEGRQGIQRLAEISRELKNTPGVRDVLSLAEVDLILTKVATAAEFLGPARAPEHGIVDSQNALAKRFRDLFEGYTHGRDGRTAALICMLDEDPRGVSREETIGQLREKIDRLAGGMVAGEPVMVVDGFRFVEEDGRRLGWVSTILLSLVLLACFHSLRWTLMAIAVVQLSLFTTRTLLVMSGLRLSMVSSMLTAVVTVVGIATVMHLIVGFREGRHAGLSPRDSFLHTGGVLASPVFWAIVTDAVGFASLMVAKVGPVYDFGLMMALGSIMSLVSVVLLVPGMAVLGPHPQRAWHAWADRVLDHQLTRSTFWLERWPKRILLIGMVVGLAGAAGSYRLELETDFTKNFRAGSRIVRAYEIIESNLGGAGVWDVVIPAPPDLDFAYLHRVRKLEQRLHSELADVSGPAGPAVRMVSIADAVWAAEPTIGQKKKRLFLRNLTANPNIKAKLVVAAMRTHMPTFTAALHSPDPQSPEGFSYRIMLRSAERQTAAQKTHLIETVTRLVREEFPEAQVTGFFVLLTNLIVSVLRDQWLAFVVATSGIAVCMLIAFRRFSYTLIAMVPNVLPIMTVTGVMGWLGFKINMGAAMIAAVSMGLSVDSSIHYIQAFQRARATGRTISASLADVQKTVGRAMVLSTLALVAGFSVLASSEFVPTVYFGVLVSLAMTGGLVGNLVMLPLLLSAVSWRERRMEASLTGEAQERSPS